MFIQFNTKLLSEDLKAEAFEHWLKKLKRQSEQTHSDFISCLENLQNDAEKEVCIIRLNLILIPHPDLITQLNSSLHNKDRLLVPKSQEEKIEEYVTYVNKNHKNIYSQMKNLLETYKQARKMQKSKKTSEITPIEILRPSIEQIVKGDKELEEFTEATLFLKEEQILIRRMETLIEANSTKLLKKQENNIQKKGEQIKKIVNDKFLTSNNGDFEFKKYTKEETSIYQQEDQMERLQTLKIQLSQTKKQIEKYLNQENGLNQSQREKLLMKLKPLLLSTIGKMRFRKVQKDFQNFLENDPKLALQYITYYLNDEIEYSKVTCALSAQIFKQTAELNYHKSLDVKGFYFNNKQLEIVKNSSFIEELNQRAKLLENIGKSNLNNQFEKVKQHFKVLDSFQGISPAQKCNRAAFDIDQFDLNDEEKRGLYPHVILALQDQVTCQELYSLAIHAINSYQMHKEDREEARMLLDELLVRYLGWDVPTIRRISPQISQIQLAGIIDSQDSDFQAKGIFQQTKNPSNSKLKGKKKKNLIQSDWQYSQQEQLECYLLPKQSKENKVLYCSQKVYCIIRLLYVIYQRLLRMKEVAQTEKDYNLFQLYFYSCKNMKKESQKFEKLINELFKTKGFLFVSIFKLFNSLVENLIECQFQDQSFRLSAGQTDQRKYFSKIVSSCFTSELNNKIIRVVYDKVKTLIYITQIDWLKSTTHKVAKKAPKQYDLPGNSDEEIPNKHSQKKVKVEEFVPQQSQQKSQNQERDVSSQEMVMELPSQLESKFELNTAFPSKPHI